MSQPFERTGITQEKSKELWIKRAVILLVVALIGMMLGALLLASVMAGEIYDYQDTVDGVHLPKVDAIVVLAGGRGRISAAGDLWYRYWDDAHRPQTPGDPPRDFLKAPYLYVSGMGHQADWAVFARQIRRGVLQVIRPENVILEHESANTEENAIWLARYARNQGWSRILLMTSSYHMKRSRLVIQKVLYSMGIQLQIETLSVYQDPFEAGEWRSGVNSFRVTLFEYLKGIYYQYFWSPPIS